MRDYVVKNVDQEGEPIVAKGKTEFYVNDIKLIPHGYMLNAVHNTPKLKIIYINEKT